MFEGNYKEKIEKALKALNDAQGFASNEDYLIIEEISYTLKDLIEGLD